uniref:Cadherin_C_2 domain-containing protein n=1 Tax=Echinostoma caproni TaxID=27848 RepID=A0A183AR02_9TREM
LQTPIRFTNGEILLLSVELKGTPYQHGNVGMIAAVTICSLLALAVLVFGAVCMYKRRHNLSSPMSRFFPLRRRMMMRRAFWRQQGDGVLVDEPDGED